VSFIFRVASSGCLLLFWEIIFLATLLGSSVAVLCNCVALPACDAQQTQLVSVILFCCELLYCSILISGKLRRKKVGRVAQSV